MGSKQDVGFRMYAVGALAIAWGAEVWFDMIEGCGLGLRFEG